MEIQGPFTLSINDNKDSGMHELHLGFKPAFQQLALAERIQSVKDHAADLQQQVNEETDEANRQGMMTILQIIEQLMPHLEADEIPLEETSVIEMGPSQASPFDDLLRGATLK